MPSHPYDPALGDEDDEEVQNFYRVPSRSHNAANGSIPSIADFANAPGRARKSNSKSISRDGSRAGSRNRDGRIRDEEQVLFDASTPRLQSSLDRESAGSERTVR